MSLPILLGLGAGAAIVAAILSSRKTVPAQVSRVSVPVPPAEVPVVLAKVMPSRSKPSGGRVPLVKFTQRRVPWRKNKKTGKQELRTQIVEEPWALASRASFKLQRDVPLPVFALATLMASEAGSGNDLAKAAIAHAALTYAKKKGGDHVSILTGKDGRFGSQHGRYASTRHAPTERDVELAEAILSGKIANPAPGADQWDSPRTQDILHKRGEPGHGTAKSVEERRTAAGKVAVYLPGVDPEYLRLWRNA